MFRLGAKLAVPINGSGVLRQASDACRKAHQGLSMILCERADGPYSIMGLWDKKGSSTQM